MAELCPTFLGDFSITMVYCISSFTHYSGLLHGAGPCPLRKVVNWLASNCHVRAFQSGGIGSGFYIPVFGAVLALNLSGFGKLPQLPD